MNVRPATEADIPAIVEMGAHFYALTEYAEFAEYSAASASVLATLLLNSGVLLVAEHGGKAVGMVGLMVAPFLFNHALKSAHEVMWWVEPDARDSGAGAALLRAIEPACRAAGAVAIQMIHLPNSPEAAARLYGRCGYRHSETSYTKVM